MKIELVQLRGTPAQISRANLIRLEFIADIRKVLIGFVQNEVEYESERKRNLFKYLFAVLVLAVNNRQDAIWWINNEEQGRRESITAEWDELVTLIPFVRKQK